ncbi:MAG: aspartate kinase, partial [Nannocystaceae bacterium]
MEVFKFGGASVKDSKSVQNVGRIIGSNSNVIIVISAMGKTTNKIVAMARELMDPPPARELDMLLSTGERNAMALLAIAIHARGQRAISLTGSQCGIITDHQPGRARIVEVRPFRILDEIAAGQIVIVGGFQGVSYKREVTTLGRGGSDTSAVALAAALGADCEIYSDVDGVYDADPRDVSGASRIDELDYEQAQALSRAGAKVLHAQAVQLAEERGIAIYARHSNPALRGQTVIRRNPVPRPTGVVAVASDPDVVSLQVVGGECGKLVDPRIVGLVGNLGLRNLAVDSSGARGIVSRTQQTNAAELVEALQAKARSLGLPDVRVCSNRALVSCIGAGLEDRHDLLARAVATLERCEIPVYEIH